MIKASAQKRSATQRLDEIIEPLIKLRDELQSTQSESDGLIQYAYNNHLPTAFKNLSEDIIKEINRIYYAK